MSQSAGGMTLITVRVQKSVGAALTRIQADIEEAGVGRANGSRITRGDIVARLIAYASTLDPAEKKSLFSSGVEAIRRAEQA